MRFEIFKVVDEARLGRLSTRHGEVDTPCFMPVATTGAVKGVMCDQLRDAGASIMLANLYHLALRPGIEVIEELGGIHASATELADLAGLYSSPELDHRQLLKVVDGALTSVRRDGDETLRPLVHDVFSGAGVALVVERNEDGAVTGFRLQAGRIRNLRYEKQ